MQEEIKILVDTDLGSTPKSMKNLKSEIKDLRDALLNLNPATEDYNKVLKAAADRAKLLSDTQYYLRTSATDLGSKITTVTKLFSGLAGGFGAVRGALTLFGADSEDLNRTMVKLQSTIALVQGLQGFEGLSKTIKSAGIQFSGAINAVRGFVTSLGTIKGALIGTGIGAFAVALGTIVAAFMRIKNAAIDAGSTIEERMQAINDAINERKQFSKVFDAVSLKVYNEQLEEILDNFASAEDLQQKLKDLDEASNYAKLKNIANENEYAYLKQKEALQDLVDEVVKLQKEMRSLERQKDNASDPASINRLNKAIAKLRQKIGDLSLSSLKDFADDLELINHLIYTDNSGDSSDSVVGQINKSIDDAIKKGVNEKYINQLKELRDTIVNTGEININADKFRKFVKDVREDIIKLQKTGVVVDENNLIDQIREQRKKIVDANAELTTAQANAEKSQLEVRKKGIEEQLKKQEEEYKKSLEKQKKYNQDRISDINDANNTITNLLKEWRETTSTEYEKLLFDTKKALYDLDESFDTILKATNSKLEDRLGDASAKIIGFYDSLDEKGKGLAFPWMNELFGFDKDEVLSKLNERSDATIEEWFQEIRKKVEELYLKKDNELSISNWLNTLLRESDLSKTRDEVNIQKKILSIYEDAEKAIKEGTLKAVDFSDYLTKASADIIITTNEQRVEQLKIILEQLNNLFKEAADNQILQDEILNHIADLDTEITNLLINNSERRITQEQKEAKNTQQQEAIKARARMQALSALGNVFSQAESLAEDNADFAKTMAVFGALINTYQAAAEAFGQGMKINFWTAFGFAATALGYGLSLVASLKRIDKSNSSSTSSAAAPTINPSATAVAPTPISYVNNVQQDSGIDDDDRRGRGDSRVYILESDIASATNLVKVRENNSRF